MRTCNVCNRETIYRPLVSLMADSKSAGREQSQEIHEEQEKELAEGQPRQALAADASV